MILLFDKLRHRTHVIRFDIVNALSQTFDPDLEDWEKKVNTNIVIDEIARSACTVLWENWRTLRRC